MNIELKNDKHLSVYKDNKALYFILRHNIVSMHKKRQRYVRKQSNVDISLYITFAFVRQKWHGVGHSVC